MESDTAVRQAFAEDVLKYAEENGIEATESITAGAGDKELLFANLMLGIYVIDTAGGARITVMWDMDWQSAIKDSYEPETEGTDSGTQAEGNAETQETGSGTEAADTENGGENEGQSVEMPASAEEEAPKGNSMAPVVIVAAVIVLAVGGALVVMKKKK